MIAWMVKNRVAANLLMGIFLIGGLIVSLNITQEVFPEFSTDIVSITLPYPGASPAEVEEGVILSVEDGVRGLEDVKRVTSVATEGQGLVYVELIRGANPFKSLQDVKNEVDSIVTFPEDAETPTVSLIESRKRVVSIIVAGNQTESALKAVGEKIRDALLDRGDATLVELSSVRTPEISVEIPFSTLREYGITLEDIANRIRQNALDLPAGTIKTSGGQILLRTKEKKDFGREFLDLPVANNPDGTIVTLSEIATVKDTFEDSDIEVELGGKPAIRVEVYRVGSETPQQISRSVDKYLTELRTELPDDITVTIWEDSSEVYLDRMNLLRKNALLGVVLVMSLLALFLEPKLAFWVTLGIPISVLGCFLFMPFTGATINMISLFAFIVSLGIVVDDAVVMGENIYEAREKGLDPLEASVVGAKGIAGPVVFAVLTNIVAFMPLFFVPGISGKFFMQIPAVVVGVFIVSLVESIFILPNHLAHTTPSTKKNKLRTLAADLLQYNIQHIYTPFVNVCVRYRYITMATAIGTLIVVLGTVVGGFLKFSFLPRIDADVVTAQVVLPVGSPIEQTRRIKEKLTAAAQQVLDENGGDSISKGIYSLIGGTLVSFGPGPASQSKGGSHIMAVQVSLVESGKRDISGSAFALAWRKALGELPEAERLQFKAETGASEGAAIQFNLSHPNRATLENAATELASALANYKGVFDIDDGFTGGKRQLDLSVSPYGKSLGLTSRELGNQLRSAFYGAEAIRQQRGRDEVKVMVRLPEEERNNFTIVENFTVLVPGTTEEVRLGEVSTIQEGTSYTEITRRDGRRILEVTADVDRSVVSEGDVIKDIVAGKLRELQQKYSGLSYSFGGEEESKRDSLGALGLGFIAALIAIFALLAIPFQSYFQPLIVMISIPFGIIGAVLGHFLLGYGLSIISMFGIIALSGVVVNDSLVLLVTANMFRDEGLEPEQAIKKAGIRRFRPIVLTSLTTFLGLAPMIFETSLQARFLIPMAISIGFGIIFATVIILGIVPALYMVLEDSKLLWGRIRERLVTAS